MRKRKSKYKQGFFNPINKSKYKGDPTKIVWRSSWELKLMSHLDKDPSVLEWQSEEFYIGYRAPTNGRIRRYFPDFKVTRKLPDGKVITEVIEVKPDKQTRPPTSKAGKRYLKEALEYAFNQAKWEAAKQYCKSRGYTFVIYTEKQLLI